MNIDEQIRIKKLVQQALPPIAEQGAPSRDLWPALLKRLDAKPAMPPWYDWALLAGLAAMLALFPSAIPVILYYL